MQVQKRGYWFNSKGGNVSKLRKLEVLNCNFARSNMFVPWSTSELRVRLALLNMFKLSSDCSKAALLLWIVFIAYVSRLSLLYCHVSSLQPYDNQLGKSWSLVSLECDVSLCFSQLLIWFLGTWLYRFLTFASLFTFTWSNLVWPYGLL